MLLLIIQITNPYSVFKFTPPIIPVVSVIKSPVFTVKSVADCSKVPFLVSWFSLPIPINLDTSTADPSGVSLSANQEILFSTIPNVFKQILSIQFLRVHDVCPLNDIQMGLIRNFFKGFIIMCFNLAFNFTLWLSKIQFTKIIRHFRDDWEINKTRKEIQFESNSP